MRCCHPPSARRRLAAESVSEASGSSVSKKIAVRRWTCGRRRPRCSIAAPGRGPDVASYRRLPVVEIEHRVGVGRDERLEVRIRPESRPRRRPGTSRRFPVAAGGTCRHERHRAAGALKYVPRRVGVCRDEHFGGLKSTRLPTSDKSLNVASKDPFRPPARGQKGRGAERALVDIESAIGVPGGQLLRRAEECRAPLREAASNIASAPELRLLAPWRRGSSRS